MAPLENLCFLEICTGAVRVTSNGGVPGRSPDAASGLSLTEIQASPDSRREAFFGKR